jgi:hypothetical protein
MCLPITACLSARRNPPNRPVGFFEATVDYDAHQNHSGVQAWVIRRV